MSDSDPRKVVGIFLYSKRRERSIQDGHEITRKEIAKEVGCCSRTIQAIERGEETSLKVIQKYIDTLELSLGDRRYIKNVLSPITTSQIIIPNDDKAYFLATAQASKAIWKCRKKPAYVMSPYWFIFCFTVPLLVLHQIPIELLENLETWHYIAMKLDSRVGIKKIRGPKWKIYYREAFRKFHAELARLNGTSSHQKTMAWLKSKRGFKVYTEEAFLYDQPKDDFVKAQTIPIYRGNKKTEYIEFGGGIPILGNKNWQRSVWGPSPDSDPLDFAEINFDEEAKKLGYGDLKSPIVLISQYISLRRLKEVGGWPE